jgi:hypothetical protein
MKNRVLQEYMYSSKIMQVTHYSCFIAATTSAPVAAAPNAQEQLKKQDDMFNNMERQYEVARLATHTHRGLGLGFGAFQFNPR